MAGKFENTTKRRSSKGLFVIGLIIVVAILVSAIMLLSSKETPGDLPTESLTVGASPERTYPQRTELSYGFLDHTMFSQYWTGGTLRCGDDFEPGDYYIMSLYSADAIYDVSDTPDGFSWSQHRIMRKVHVEQGQYVRLSGAILVPADEVEPQNLQKYGVFCVGKDLPAGDYKVVSITDEYYTEITRMSGICGAYQISEGSPESNPIACTPLFENQYYVSLKDGQYIIIVNAKLTLSGQTEDTTVLEQPVQETTVPQQESTIAFSENESESKVYQSFITATNLCAEDLTKKSSSAGVAYYYKGHPLLSEDAEWIENPINKEGTVNQGAIYRKIAKLLAGFNMFLNDGSDYCELLTGMAYSNRDAFLPYVSNASEFICMENGLYHTLKKFEKTESVSGTFDFSNNTFHFVIDDLTSCAVQMQISEEMLGYVLAMMDEYAFSFTFNGNSCSVDYDALVDFGWN